MSIPDATHFWQCPDAHIKVTGKPLISLSISVFEAWIFERINYLFGVYNMITRLGVDKVKPKGWVWGCGDFRFWGLGLHAENGGLPQVLPLAVHLKFF